MNELNNLLVASAILSNFENPSLKRVSKPTCARVIHGKKCKYKGACKGQLANCKWYLKPKGKR